MNDVTISYPTLHDARMLGARLVCRVRGHRAPDHDYAHVSLDEPLTVDRLLKHVGPRHCQRCRVRMPGDPQTPMERLIAETASASWPLNERLRSLYGASGFTVGGDVEPEERCGCHLLNCPDCQRQGIVPNVGNTYGA